MIPDTPYFSFERTIIMQQFQDKTETQISSELIYDGKVVHLYVDQVRLPDGNPALREYVHHIGAVCVLPLDAEQNVLCVRQYRYPFAKELIEIPAGKLDSREEDHREAALRELREETGATCKRLTYLGAYYGSPAILDECIDMYLAEDLTLGELSLDDDEFLDLVKIPLSTMVDMVLAGEIPDGKTQVAVIRVNEMLRRRGDTV